LSYRARSPTLGGVRWMSSDGNWVVELIKLTATGNGRDGEWLRISHRGFFVGEARDWDGVAVLGADISDLRETLGAATAFLHATEPALRAEWIKFSGDQHTGRGAAPARSRAVAPCPGPDRPGVRAAAGCRGARARRSHVCRAPQPRVPARLRRVTVRIPDDAAHRTGDGTVAPRRPQRHRGLLRGRLLVTGHFQQPLRRPGRGAAQHLPAPCGARYGGDSVVRGQAGDKTGQESRSAGSFAVAILLTRHKSTARRSGCGLRASRSSLSPTIRRVDPIHDINVRSNHDRLIH
jgi:hypothetical protein